MTVSKTNSSTDRINAVRAQVWEAIQTVTDPELDESIADLGFIQSLTLKEPPLDSRPPDRFDVHLTFRLPTYWCAANFAFIMAEDLRERLAQVPSVNEVRVELADHFTSGEINRGIAAGKPFDESFPDENGGNLKDLRRLFRLKAFQRRQYAVLRHLLDTLGDTPDVRSEILSMTITQLRALSITSDEAAKRRTAYLDILPEFDRHSPGDSASAAFILPSGKPLNTEGLDDYLRQLRRTTTNIEFNAAICSSLLKSRNSE